ncbi:hypothetical protein WN943_023155 [Citrus x changshan-huyou]
MYQYSTHQISHSPFLDSSTENSLSQSDSSSIESSDLSDSDTSDSNLTDISKLLMVEPTKQSGAIDTGPRTKLVDTDDENHETGESSQSIPPQPKALAILHDQFIGEPSATFEVARLDYLNVKCCSLNTKDLHYQASLPEELQPEIQYQLATHKLNIDTLSLGKLFQIALGCLDEILSGTYQRQRTFQICLQKALLGYQMQRSKKVFFRKRQSSSRDFPNKRKIICFICKKKGHFTKDCPVKPQKAIKLIQHLKSTTDFSPTTDQVEHLFSEQEEPNEDTVFALPAKSSDSDSSDFEPIYTVQSSSIFIHDRTIPIPSIKIQIIPSKYHKPIIAISFLDTGA